MDAETRRLLDRLSRSGGQIEAKALRAIDAAFRGVDLAPLIRELLTVMELRNPAARLAARERLQSIAASLLPDFPPPLTLALTEGVQLGGTVGVGMLQTGAVTLEVVSPAVQAAAATTEARYLAYWGDGRAEDAARLGRVITQALTTGGKRYPVKAEIQAALNVSKSKARNLARDGINAALSEGQAAVWDTAREDLGLRMVKTWLHAGRGKDSRSDHVRLDGKTVDYDADFIPGVLARPHDPRGGAKHNANCRCSMICRVLED